MIHHDSVYLLQRAEASTDLLPGDFAPHTAKVCAECLTMFVPSAKCQLRAKCQGAGARMYMPSA